MRDSIQDMLDGSRKARNEGRADEALNLYEAAAEAARIRGEEDLLIHALRHVSDLAREAGSAERALAAGTEAVDLCAARSQTPPLERANALRVKALALDELAREGDAAASWREARMLYAQLGVEPGVAECDARLEGG